MQLTGHLISEQPQNKQCNKNKVEHTFSVIYWKFDFEMLRS